MCWKVGWMRACGESCKRAVLSKITQGHKVLFVLLWQTLFPFLFSCTWISSLLSGIKRPSAQPLGLSIGSLWDLCRCPYFYTPEQQFSFYILDKKELILALKGGAQSVQAAHVIIRLSWFTFVQFVHFDNWKWKKGRCLYRQYVKLFLMHKHTWIHFWIQAMMFKN